MLALASTMPSTPPPPIDEDSDYEYEYHEFDTETFFLNIDLSTHHGPIRPPRRRNDPTSSTTATTPQLSTCAPPSDTVDQDPTIASTETDNVSGERVQILGLHTPNPLISYHNHIFSGSWADQIGTELLFTRPEPPAQLDSDPAPPQILPLRHTQDFDLIAANSVKILARKANLISCLGPTPSVTPSTPHTPEVYKPESHSNQARFLNRLMQVKKSKGETDMVRTVFSLKRGPTLEERLRGWARTDEQLAAIERLNARALEGDSEAIMELENIYAQLGGQDGEPSEGPSSRPG